jgi:asparagine synthase (glutamine-hydrolysing)
MAWQKPAPGTLPAYTFGGPFRDCQDVLVARKVAGICGQSHQVITVADEFLSGFARYAERSIYLSEGSVDVYRSPDLYVSEKARAIAPVKIVGTYGSEIIRQSVMFKPGTASAGLFPPDFRASVDRAAETYAEVRRGHPVTFAAFRQSPWYHYGLLNLEQSQLTVRSPYLDNDFVRTVYRAPKSNLENGDVRLRLVKDGNPALARLCSDRGVGGDAGPLPAMAIRGFLEFTFKAEYAYDYGMPQWLSRMDDLVSPLRLERLFLGRHKFFHFRTFYKHALAGYVRQMLLDPKTLSRPYLEPGSVEAVVRGHLDDGRNYTSEIHKLLTLELIHRLFLDPQ